MIGSTRQVTVWAYGAPADLRKGFDGLSGLVSRSHDAARQVLNGYRGIVIADGYGAYDALARAGPSFTLAHCWAHVRRKFVEAEPHYPAPCAEVRWIRSGNSTPAERSCPGLEVGASDDVRIDALALRAARHREQSAPIVAAIHTWAHQQRTLPESSLGKAIAYMLGLWPGLTRFLDDSRIALDNDATERGLRSRVCDDAKSFYREHAPSS